MAAERARPGLGGSSISPDLVAQRGFITARRGFDPAEVKAFLAQVADEMRAVREREATLDQARRDAEERAAHPTFDESTLMAAVGEETASILGSARAAAADIRAKAEDHAARILKESHDRAAAQRDEAESVLSRRTAEAEGVAAQITAKATAEAERMREAARQEAAAVRGRAELDRKVMVDAAQGARDRIVADLTRRRRTAVLQIEQLRAGRDRLLEAYTVVRRTLDEVTGELQRADAEARSAAEAVGRRPLLSAEPEDEVEAALFGLPGPGGGPASGGGTTGAEDDGPGDDRQVVDLRQSSGDVAGGPTGGPGRSGRAGQRGGGSPATGATGGRGGDGPRGGEGSRSGQAGPLSGGAAGPLSGGAAGPLSGGAAGATGPTRVVDERRPASIRSPRRQKESREGPDRPGEPPRPGVAEGLTSAPARPGAPGAEPVVEVADGGPSGDGGSGPPPMDAPGQTSANADERGPTGALFARIRADRAGEVVEARRTSGPMEAGAEPDQSAPAPDGEGVVSTEDEAILQRRDDAVGDIESGLARRLKRVLQDEQNDLLDRLRGLAGPAVPSGVLPDLATHTERFAAVARPALQQAAGAGAAFAASFGPRAGGDCDVDDLADDLATAVVVPLRRRLEQALADSRDGGDDLAGSVGAAYREWKAQRIEQAAADHVASAFARAAFAATPDGTRSRWLVDDVGGPCPDCDDNALAGAVAKGEPFPTGQQWPPAHAGCRCVLVPQPVASAE